MKVINKHFVAGIWQECESAQELVLQNPANEESYAVIKLADSELTNTAVSAANRAFNQWNELGFAKRAQYIEEIVKHLHEKRDLFVDVIVQELGCPREFTEFVHVDDPISAFEDHIQYAKDLAKQFDDSEQRVDPQLSIRKEGIGVCALITPWNYPLHQLVAKVAPALVAGCTLVVKPSEITPQTAIILAQAIAAANLPAGVFNLLIGTGAEVGNTLAAHPDVDCISFTGSTAVGKLIQRVASNNVKRVSLELGGKSAFIIALTDNLTQAVTLGVEDVMCNSGQTCVALTRMLVHKSQYQQACDIAATHAQGLKLAPPESPDVFLGPVISAKQYKQVKDYIAIGLNEGAKLIAGGSERPSELSTGYYIKPTIFADVNNAMRIAREEVFGPVLSIIPYENETQAIAIANDSDYGLCARIWADEAVTAKNIVRKVRAGLIFINDAQWHNAAPFGGYKQSGNGRELGVEGINEFLEIKSIVNA